ncbi:MAG TPA: methylmalonyl-CoA epimerase [Trueperaceae bacterium]
MNELPEAVRGLPLDHVAIAVEDLDSGAAPYVQLGLEVVSEEALPEQGVRLRMLQAGSSRLELIEPLDAHSPLASFLSKRGQGLHHLALRVEDIDEKVSRLRSSGALFTTDEPRAGHGGSRVIFLHPSWTGGVLLELVEHG